jgi:hypothetical protein
MKPKSCVSRFAEFAVGVLLVGAVGTSANAQIVRFRPADSH